MADKVELKITVDSSELKRAARELETDFEGAAERGVAKGAAQGARIGAPTTAGGAPTATAAGVPIGGSTPVGAGAPGASVMPGSGFFGGGPAGRSRLIAGAAAATSIASAGIAAAPELGQEFGLGRKTGGRIGTFLTNVGTAAAVGAVAGGPFAPITAVLAGGAAAVKTLLDFRREDESLEARRIKLGTSDQLSRAEINYELEREKVQEREGDLGAAQFEVRNRTTQEIARASRQATLAVGEQLGILGEADTAEAREFLKQVAEGTAQREKRRIEGRRAALAVVNQMNYSGFDSTGIAQ